MRKKAMSIYICAMIVVSISSSITQNVGEMGSIGTVCPTLPDSPEPDPQVVGQPSLSSGGSGGLADSPWPMFRQNLNHTGLSPDDTSGNPGQLKWSFTTGGIVFSSPAVGSDGTIYVGSWDGKLYAITPNGTEKWSFTTGDRIEWSSPAIGFDDTIYVGSWDGKLYAITPNGTEKWSFTTNDTVNSSPVIGFDGTIYVGSGSKLFAINPNGTEKWIFKTISLVHSSPAIGSNGTIYVGSDDHKLYAINLDGTEKWNFTTGNDVFSSPAIGPDGTIYVGSCDLKLYAINPDGSEKWNLTTGGIIDSSPAIGSDGTIYVGSQDYKLYAITPDGTEKWIFPTGDFIHHSSPAISSDGTIYIGSCDYKLYAICPDGTEKWSFTTGREVLSSPAIGSDGTIYVGSYDSKLYAIGTLPIADAGPDQTVNEGDVVQLIGCNSSGSLSGVPISVDPSVVALWHMDEGNGSIIYDETINNNDGTINGPTWTSGKFGSALRFGDTDLVYEIPASFDDSITTNITVVAWVYWEGPHPGTYSPNSYIFDARDFEGTRGGFILYLDPSGTLIFILLYGNNAGDYQIVQSTCNVPINRWTHIASILDYTSGELKIYINGNEDTSVPGTEPYRDFGGSHWNAAIGNNRYAPGDKKWAPFNGIIDEVVIYNEALAAQELPSTPAKIISYEWDFDASDGIDWDNPDTTGPTPTHVYGDDGEFIVTLRVTDDTGLDDTDTCNVTVNNVAPIVDALPAVTINEFESVTLTGHATDPGSDDLTFTWNWGYAPWSDKTTIYYNEGMGPDPFPSPAVNPRNITEDAICQFGDDGVFTIIFTVTDDDGESTTVMTNVTVNNVAPTVTIESVTMDVEIGLRVAGRKFNDVGMILYEEGNPIGNVSIERMPGSPNEQMAWIPITLDMTKTYNATVTYTPEDPPNVGANPVWIYLKSKDGTIKKIHHTFNVQQSKKRNSDHWNHVEPWEVDLNDYFIGLPFEITSHITDPGSDDLTLTYTYGSQIKTITYLNNPPYLDPYPSPEVKPMDILDVTTLTYEGAGTITLVVKDDDNIRLGIGEGTDSINIT